MKRIFVSSVQKEFERERAAIKKMIESDPILKILEILAKEPTCTYDELAEQLSVSRRAITKQIKNLREAGKLRRIGPDKGGHWEVVGMANE